MSHLLISGDGYLERIELSNRKIDEHGIVRVPARVKIPEANFGELSAVLQQEISILRQEHLQWSTASGKARMALDVESIQMDQIEKRANGESGSNVIIPVTLRFWPGENREGGSMENPLPDYMGRWMREPHIAMMRLFKAPDQFLNSEEVEQVEEGNLLKYHSRADLMEDGRILLPCNPVRYPVRFDRNVFRLPKAKEVITGAGRGAINTVQPLVNDVLREIPPHAYRITATQFSILAGLRAVIDPVVLNLKTHTMTYVRHGTSVLWDGGRTTGLGPNHQRHLELENIGDEPLHTDQLGVAVRVYKIPGQENSKVLHSLPQREVHEKGISVDQFLRDKENADELRSAFDRLRKTQDLYGLVVGPSGIRRIYAESTQNFQDQSVIAASEGAMASQFDAKEKWPQLKDLQEFLGHVSDHSQRAMLLTKEAPSVHVLSSIMQLGVRGICTPNVARTDDEVYVTDSLLQQYAALGKQGFGIYLLTPGKIRKLWHQLFVDLQAFERVTQSDFRIGGYGSSAGGAEHVMQRGKLYEALAAIKSDFPNAAMVTGASDSGGMGLLQHAAKEAGLVTIGVSNKIPGQESANDDIDAVTHHDRFDFVARQGLISRMVSMPWVSIGAEGTNFEESLERVHRKIALGPLSPISYIDPGRLLNKKKNMWSPVTDLQKVFSETHYPDNKPGFQLSRSPYVGSLLYFTRSYLAAYERTQEFIDNPEKYLSSRGVPEEVIGRALDSILRDSEYTGLPVHAFWQKAMQKFRGNWRQE